MFFSRMQADLLFNSPWAHTHLPRARPWILETVRGDLRKVLIMILTHFECVLSRASVSGALNAIPAEEWSSCLENRVELFQYNIHLCLFWCGDADVTNRAGSQCHRRCVWEGLASGDVVFTKLTKFKNKAKSYGMCETLSRRSLAMEFETHTRSS